MEDKFDYQSVPVGYAHCFNGQCSRGEQCMRHLVAKNCTTQHATIPIINPLCIPAETSMCAYFKPIEKIRVAWGVAKLFDELPSKVAKGMKSEILAHFGRNTYYRLYRQERGLTPEDQEYIRQVFRRNKIENKLTFERYSDRYNFFC